MARVMSAPRLKAYLSQKSAKRFGMPAATHSRYKNGELPPEFAGFLAAHPVAAFDLTVDFIETKIGTLPPHLAVLLDLTRRELAATLAASELPDSLPIAA